MSPIKHTERSDGYVSFDDEKSLLALTEGNIVLCSHIEDFRGGIDYLRHGEPVTPDVAECMNTISMDILFSSAGEQPALRKALADLLQQGADLLPEGDPSIAPIRQNIHDRAAHLRGDGEN